MSSSQNDTVGGNKILHLKWLIQLFQKYRTDNFLTWLPMNKLSRDEANAKKSDRQV